MDTGLFATLTGLSGHVLDFLAQQSLYAAAVAVVVWTVLAIVRPRHPFLHLALWWFVLARLLLPADFATSWSLRSTGETLLAQIVWPQGEPHVNVVGAEGSVPVSSLAAEPPATEPEALAMPVEEGAATDILPLALFLFWLGGAAAMTILLVRAERSARHAISMAEPAEEPLLLQLVDGWARRFRVSRHVRLLITAEATAPFTAGLFRPVIVLPRQLLSKLDAVEMSAVIGHEMSHIRSFDVAWRMAERVLLVLFFFHPLVWMAVRRIDTAREAACDVAAANSGMVARTSYAKGLLAALKAFRIEPETAFARTLSIQGGTSDGLKTRLIWLKGETLMSTRSKLLGTVGIVGLGMLVLPMAQARHAVPDLKEDTALALVAPEVPAAPVAPVAPAAPATIKAVPVPPSAPAVKAAQAPAAPRAPKVVVEPQVPDVPDIRPAVEVDLGEDFGRDIEREVRLAAAEARREAQLAAAEAHRESLQAQMEARRAADEARRDALLEAAEARREALQEAAAARREARQEAEEARREAADLEREARQIRSQAMRQAVTHLRQTAQRLRTNPDLYLNNGIMISGTKAASNREELNQAAAELEAEANRLEREIKAQN